MHDNDILLYLFEKLNVWFYVNQQDLQIWQTVSAKKGKL